MRVSWTQFKTFQTARKTDILMLEDSNFYYLFTSEEGFSADCTIDKNASDDTELEDFETNYKSLCNPEKVQIVTPTAPLNQLALKPYGFSHAHINSASNHIYAITLSNKNLLEYDYLCLLATPAEYDCIVNSDCTELDEVEDVDSQSGTLELFSGVITVGVRVLIKPYVIDFVFPNEYEEYQIWGFYGHVKDYGDDDHLCLQILDTEDIVIAEYDEIWAHTIAKNESGIFLPNKSNMTVKAGYKGRILYYPKDITKTDIKIWFDYSLSIPS